VTAVATRYETTIGLEVHVQLTTRSKMFCPCSAEYSGAAPNTHVCPVCLGAPGVLPVINEKAIELIAMTGLALGCRIASFSKFDRKNYPYPDLPKGYQISQYDLPICVGGHLDVVTDAGPRRVGITRIHMEEDTGRLLHRVDGATGEPYSLIDLNRAGTPLMEIVSEPDIRTAAEARDYLVRLRQVLRYIGVSTANMEDGQMRCDANISLRPAGAPGLGAKVEVKNMNSFRAVHDALIFEERRQAEALDRGERIVQETRGWVDERGVTVSQRTKEVASDYRYFPEPDLPPLRFSEAYVESLRARLPELPEARKRRFVALGLSEHEAVALVETRERAEYFEALAAALAGDAARSAKVAANWVLGEVARWTNESGRDLAELPVSPASLAELIGLVESGGVTAANGKEVFAEMARSGGDARSIVASRGLATIEAGDELLAAAREAIAANPKAVEDYRAGKEAAIKFLVGKVMQQTHGRASPQKVLELLTSELAAK
jgi:aspartyl-tRNA(Asn)/glutamyl-tRNA(Gln) amidotransferase subunit B